MKKARKLGLQSLALVLMAFVLVAGVAFGMTGAWFTDTLSDDQSFTMGEKVRLAAISVDAPVLEGTRVNADGQVNNSPSLNLADMMPGDALTWTFDINKAEHAEGDVYSDFMSRIKVAVKYNSALVVDNDKFDLTLTYVYGNGSTNIDAAAGSLTNDGNYAVLDRAITDSNHYTVTIVLTLNGPEFANSDALKGITIEVTVDAIQAANYAASNWDSTTANAVGTGRDTIVAYGDDFDRTNKS